MRLLFKLPIIITTLLVLSCREKQAPISTSSKAPAFYQVTGKGGLKLRNEPTMTGRVLKTIPFGTKVKVVNFIGEEIVVQGTKGKWAEINAATTQGYAFGGFLTPVADTDCMIVDSAAALVAVSPSCLGQDCNNTDTCLSGSAFFPDGTAELLRNCHASHKGEWRISGRNITATYERSATPEGGSADDCPDSCLPDESKACVDRCKASARDFQYKISFIHKGDNTYDEEIDVVALDGKALPDALKSKHLKENQGCLRKYTGRRN